MRTIVLLLVAISFCACDPEAGDSCSASEEGEMVCFSDDAGDYVECVQGEWRQGDPLCYCRSDESLICQ